MNHTSKGAHRKIDMRVHVLEWLNRGVLCVPINRGNKKPRGGEGWNKLRITEETINEFFKSSDNIGGLWGRPSSWIVDVDLDCDEAVSIARVLLPRTFTYGRGQRPATHYLYKCVDVATQKWIDEKKEMVVELRSTGSQSVLPPSIHPDDDRFAIEEDREFTSITPVSLRLLVGRIAALSILARHYPAGGGRHDYVSAMAGALSHAGMNDNDVVIACGAVLDACNDRESDAEQRRRTILNTIGKSKDNSNRTYGWPKLGEYMSALALSNIKRWLTRDSAPMPEVIREIEKAPVYQLPKHLLTPPGLVGDIMRWSSSYAYVKQPVIDLATALMCVSMVSLNRYVVAKWTTPLQPYMMVMAPTSGGKETALNNVYEFCRRIRLGDFCFQGFQSYHSLLDKLGEAPNIACWLWDEAGRKLKSASKSTGSQDYQVMSWLLSLYGRAAKHVPGLTARGTAIEAMDFPFLTILAATQPALLIEAVTDADLATGVVNRFLMFDAGDDAPAVNVEREEHPAFPARIEAAIKLIRERPVREGNFPFHTIQFEPKAYVAFREFENQCIRAAGGAEMWGRANQNALILAGILAVGLGGSKVTITEECASWAIEFVRWSIARWTARVGGATHRTQTEGHSKLVERYIMGARDLSAQKGLRANQIAMLKKGKMPRAVLSRMCRHLNSRDLDGVILQLKQSELIAENEEDGMVIYAPL